MDHTAIVKNLRSQIDELQEELETAQTQHAADKKELAGANLEKDKLSTEITMLHEELQLWHLNSANEFAQAQQASGEEAMCQLEVKRLRAELLEMCEHDSSGELGAERQRALVTTTAEEQMQLFEAQRQRIAELEHQLLDTEKSGEPTTFAPEESQIAALVAELQEERQRREEFEATNSLLTEGLNSQPQAIDLMAQVEAGVDAHRTASERNIMMTEERIEELQVAFAEALETVNSERDQQESLSKAYEASEKALCERRQRVEGLEVVLAEFSETLNSERDQEESLWKLYEASEQALSDEKLRVEGFEVAHCQFRETARSASELNDELNSRIEAEGEAQRLSSEQLVRLSARLSSVEQRTEALEVAEQHHMAECSRLAEANEAERRRTDDLQTELAVLKPAHEELFNRYTGTVEEVDGLRGDHLGVCAERDGLRTKLAEATRDLAERNAAPPPKPTQLALSNVLISIAFDGVSQPLEMKPLDVNHGEVVEKWLADTQRSMKLKDSLTRYLRHLEETSSTFPVKIEAKLLDVSEEFG